MKTSSDRNDWLGRHPSICLAFIALAILLVSYLERS